jgi:hypothetical protein
LDHPELQETKGSVRSINTIYEKQISYGVDITDLVILNTEQGSMGLCMGMFLDHYGPETDTWSIDCYREKREEVANGKERKIARGQDLC